MKVCLGLILSHGFPVPAAFLEGLIRLQHALLTAEFNRPEASVTACRMIFSHAFPIDTARNEICRLFLDHDDAPYLVFLDSDMKHPPDLVHRLLAHRREIVSGRYQMRRAPFFTVAMRKTGEGANDYQAIDKVEPTVKGLMAIDAGGAGALLIHRGVLEAIRARVGDDWFRYQNGPSGLRTVSEDMWFFEQAKACGYQAYLDADASCTHLGQFEIDAQWHVPFQDAYRQAVQA